MNRFLATAVCLSVLFPEPRSAQAQDRFTPLNDEEACSLLDIAKQPLPAWARILARSLPATTVAMLELDALHRAHNPLGPMLSGKLRWVAADALHCLYGRSHAESDLRRAGLDDGALKMLREDSQELGNAERLALALARKLTLAAHTVTDAEMETLLKHHDAEKVVAMVHTLAHANFQNRVFLALGVELEKERPLPPSTVKRDPKAKLAAPERPAWKSTLAAEVALPAWRPDWRERGLDDVRKTLEAQKERKGRIPLPQPERLSKLPPETRARAQRIAWTHVSVGYQPALTSTWFGAMDRFHAESKLDRVFANTFFWVITRRNECFY